MIRKIIMCRFQYVPVSCDHILSNILHCRKFLSGTYSLDVHPHLLQLSVEPFSLQGSQSQGEKRTRKQRRGICFFKKLGLLCAEEIVAMYNVREGVGMGIQKLAAILWEDS